MSLITRCPACGTMFKVVPDQLRISEGWVRCGHCAEVFDASAHLQADAPPSRYEPEPEAARPPAPETAGPQEAETPWQPARPAPQGEPEEFASSLNTEVDTGLPLDALDSAQLEDEARALRETPLDRPFELRRQDAADEVAQPLPSSVSATSSFAKDA
jgi:predicted Zn finger-like uncharacterized protein